MKTIIAVVALALLWQWLFRGPPPRPTCPLVAQVSKSFQALVEESSGLQIKQRGVLNWDQRTFVWNKFAEKFGSNPNTPYMYNVLPLGGLLPSPMWRLKEHDVVVLLFRRPPPVEYFSFTTFCLGSWKRGLVFASLGDSLNSHSPLMAETNHTLFAHVVVTQSSGETLKKIHKVLIQSGISEDAIHAAVVPNTLAMKDSLQFYEVVLRIFRFQNQTQGDEYLQSKQPVYYIKGTPRTNDQLTILPKPSYKKRTHIDHIDEPAMFQTDLMAHIGGNIDEPALLQTDFMAFQITLLTDLHQTFEAYVQPISMAPLYIRGLDCLDHIGHQCLGDCPDAAYFGSMIQPASDSIESLILKHDDEFHLAVMVDHRYTNTSIYSNIALLKTHKKILNKTKLDVRGTSIGVLSNHEYHPSTDTTKSPFFSWIFTRNPEHCSLTRQLEHVQGCTVIDDKKVSRDSYFAYCERLYLNPVTGTGPDWNKILPAQLHHFSNVQPRTDKLREEHKQKNADLFAQLRLPPSNVPLKVFQGDQKLKFLHIIKTGGESLERYLWGKDSNLWRSAQGPQMDYAVCRQAAMANITASKAAISTAPCWAIATTISSLLCGLNCECCAADLYSEGAFHGTLLRSPRAHTLSLFSHGHNAHYSTWERMASDVSLYAAEGFLRGAELLCNHSGTGGVEDWKVALEDNLKASLTEWPLNSAATGVQVIPLRNVQAHSLTCSKQHTSLGQHFRVPAEALEPNLEEALAALHRIEWIGVTDLYHPSLCLLHYQANQTLPPKDCDCRHPNHHTNDPNTKPLGHWVEIRTKRGRSVQDLSSQAIELVDAHTTIDAEVFAAGLRLVLGRLRRMEEVTGTSILECIDWHKLQRKTDYIPGLWTNGPEAWLDRSSE